MKKTILKAFVALFLMVPVGVMAQTTIVIDIAPNVLNIGSSGTVFTIHTDIKFSEVAGATCTLNGLEIDWWKSDDRGFFVAKLDIDAVKALSDLKVGEMNTLTLSGEKYSGELFSGSQDVKVISVLPKGKK